MQCEEVEETEKHCMAVELREVDLVVLARSNTIDELAELSRA